MSQNDELRTPNYCFLQFITVHCCSLLHVTVCVFKPPKYVFRPGRHVPGDTVRLSMRVLDAANIIGRAADANDSQRAWKAHIHAVAHKTVYSAWGERLIKTWDMRLAAGVVVCGVAGGTPEHSGA